VSARPRFALVHRTLDEAYVIQRAATYALVAHAAAEWLARWRRGALTPGRGHCRAWGVGRYTWRLIGPEPECSASWLEITDERRRLP
jgi:hypothetical protein